MRTSGFTSRLLSSQTSRFGIEILVSLILFSWLSWPMQILATVVVSLIVELLAARALKNDLREEFESQDWSGILQKANNENS